MTQSAATADPSADARAAILLTAGLTLARLVAVFRTPLELYPDEAQYWLWSRTLDFGYYSKPPMIAWTIWATTRIGGDAEAWIRLGAPLFQGGAMLMVYLVGRRLYDSRVGLAAAALYALAPAIQLSAAVMATDAPLLFFLGLTLLAYVGLLQAAPERRALHAAGLGAALGLAFLSKYAAVYALIGLMLHAITAPEARRAWSWAALKHLALEPAVVFHADGYKGDGEALIAAFNREGAPGVPLLQWYGMTADAKSAAESGVAPFPHMLRWLR